MADYVLDASAALSFVVSSQATPASRLFAGTEDELLVPDIFFAEVRHALLRLERRGLADRERWLPSLSNLEKLVTGLAPLEGRTHQTVLEIATIWQLGYYDAIYLHAAVSESATLVSRDAALLVAAAKAGVACIDLR